MKKVLLSFLPFISVLLCQSAIAQTTATDGNWSANSVVMKNTPEADVMIRTGDIDNLNFGWEEGFNPFTGKPTPIHAYPWEPSPSDVPGLDRILVGSGFGKNESNCGADGYSNVGREDSRPVPIILPLGSTKGMEITSAALTLFVDDFQAQQTCSKYRAYLNGRRFADLEKILNAIDQGGPIGKFISVRLTPDVLPLLQGEKLMLLIDDSTSGAHDGYAIDFVKLLINPKPSLYKGDIIGEVRDAETQRPIIGATVQVRGYLQTTSGTSGGFSLGNIPVGINVVEASARGYQTNTALFDIVADETAGMQIIYLTKAADLDYDGKQLQTGDAITLKNIQFAQSSAELTAESKTELDKLVTLMSRNPRIEIELSGHTSNEGTAQGNRTLSLARVQSCKNYLVRQGVDEARITVIGYGPDKPVAPNDTEANRAKNRRVEMKIAKM